MPACVADREQPNSTALFPRLARWPVFVVSDSLSRDPQDLICIRTPCHLGWSLVIHILMIPIWCDQERILLVLFIATYVKMFYLKIELTRHLNTRLIEWSWVKFGRLILMIPATVMLSSAQVRGAMPFLFWMLCPQEYSPLSLSNEPQEFVAPPKHYATINLDCVIIIGNVLILRWNDAFTMNE